MTADAEWAGRFPANDIIGLLDNFPRHNLGESTSQDLMLGELLDLVGLDRLRHLRLGYVSAAGTAELRDQISRLSGAPAHTILTTQGVGLALFLLAFEHCRPGDEAVVLTPCFPPSRDTLVGAGVQVRPAPLAFDQGYRMNLDAITASLSPRTKLVSLASPQNPSGVRVREGEVAALLQAMSAHAPHALLLIDEIYRDATYGDASAPDSFATHDARVITTGSVSKAHGAPGLRVGWLTVPDPDLLARLTVAKMNITLSSSALDEALAERILAHREEILAPRRAFLAQALDLLGDWHATQEHRLDWIQPEGGAMCCLRLRPDHFDDDAVTRFWQRLRQDEIQLGCGLWFGESARVFRLGFGYLPLPDFHLALEQLATTMDGV
ncbi:MAG TPA: pyridoxal phosphate-dependent aminotransferase, partial [Vicinamibacterales bacterium]